MLRTNRKSVHNNYCNYMVAKAGKRNAFLGGSKGQIVHTPKKGDK